MKISKFSAEKSPAVPRGGRRKLSSPRSRRSLQKVLAIGNDAILLHMADSRLGVARQECNLLRNGLPVPGSISAHKMQARKMHMYGAISA